MHMRRILFSMVLVASACGGAKQSVKADDTAAKDPVVTHDGDGDGTGDDPDGMQVEGTQGHIAPEEAQTVIQASFEQLSACWQSEVTTHRYVGGHVELAMHIDRDGTVKTAKVADGDLGSWPVEKCLIAHALTMQFPKPKGGPEADVSFPLDFPTQSKNVRDMDEKRAGAELGKKIPELDKCADGKVATAPNDVQVTVYVGPGGAVQSAGFATSDATGFDEAWGDCALEKAKAWKMTDPRGVIWKGSAAYQGKK